MLRPKRCEGAGEAFAVVGHVDAHDAAALLDPADTRIPRNAVEDRLLFKDRLDDLFARFERIEVTFEDQPAAFERHWRNLRDVSLCDGSYYLVARN